MSGFEMYTNMAFDTAKHVVFIKMIREASVYRQEVHEGRSEYLKNASTDT